MRRREVISGLGSVISAWPLAARAQQAGKIHRVGLIFTTARVSEMTGPDPIQPNVRAFVHGLRDRGYVEGRNLILEHRSADGRFERFGDIVAELVGRKADVIVTTGNEMTRAAKRVTSTVPIVMATVGHPVAARIVASLARPGGNITGFTVDAGSGIEAKRLQMLKEAVPAATRVAFLGVKSVWEGPDGTSVRAAAHTLGVTVVHAEHSPTHYADAFALITRDRPQALFVARHSVNFVNRRLIAEFAVEQRMPGAYPNREYIEAGGLMSYGASLTDIFRRVAGHVDKILKGAKPAELPVEQPTKFELVINGKAAKALGLTIPPLLLVKADEVIE
jgi:putative tryptophan/tyrosine transport system substrate-binding protein